MGVYECACVCVEVGMHTHVCVDAHAKHLYLDTHCMTRVYYVLQSLAKATLPSEDLRPWKVQAAPHQLVLRVSSSSFRESFPERGHAKKKKVSMRTQN